MRIATAAICLMFALAACVAAADDEEVLVRVNGEPVTRADLNQQLAASMGGVELAVDPDVMSVVQQRAAQKQREKQALNALIESRLLFEKARLAYFTEDTAEDAIEQIGQSEWDRFIIESGSRLRATQRLAPLGLTPSAYRELRVQGILIGKLLMDEVYEHINVSPRAMREYYDSHREQFDREPQIVYREIVLVVLDDEDREKQRAKAEEALAELRQGADFGEVADRYGHNVSRYPGGLRTLKLPAEDPEYRPEAVKGLEVGQVSDVREIEDTLVIARLEEVAEGGAKTFAEAQETIRRTLLNEARREALAEYLARLHARARVDYTEAGMALRD